MKYAIFDLDMTLVNSEVAAGARKRRAWGEVYSLIPQFRLYDGVTSVMEHIRKNGIRTCIVSTSPHSYVQRVVDHFNLPIDYIVGFHDAAAIKPSPAPMNEALRLLGCDACEAVSFGDRAIDILSSNAAGIKSVACTWGTSEYGQLLSSGYSSVASAPIDMIQLL